VIKIGVQITDTGKYNVRDSAAPSGEVKANSGSAFTLNNVKLDLDMEQNLSYPAQINKLKNDTATNEYDWTEVDVNGIKFPEWKIHGVIDMADATDQANYGYIQICMLTKGVKKLEYSTTEDRQWTPIFCKSVYANANSVDYIYVRFKHLHVEQDANSGMIKYTIDCVETGGISTNLT